MSIESLLRKGLLAVEGYKAEFPDKTHKQLSKMLKRDEIIKLSFNENPYGPSPKAIASMQEIVSKLHIYTDHEGVDLKNAIANKFCLKPENVIYSNGADEMITMICNTFLNEGEEVIIPVPTFGQYKVNVLLMNAQPILVKCCDDFQIDLEGIRQQINKKTKLIFLCNPNNPTGLVISKEQMDAFVKSLPDHVILVIDEAYIEYADHSQIANGIDYVRNNDRVIIIRTFSKIYGMAGARIGYAFASEEIIFHINRVRMPVNINWVGMEGAIASLDDDEHIAKIREYTSREKKYLYNKFDEMGLIYIPSQTCFILVNLGRDSKKVMLDVAQDGIIIRPAHDWGYPNYARISLGNHEQNEKLVAAMKKALR